MIKSMGEQKMMFFSYSNILHKLHLVVISCCNSHFDGIRALVFHPVEPVLITAAEDHMLKLWNLQKTVPAKRSVTVARPYRLKGQLV